MDINNFPPEFVDDITKASFTNRKELINEWLNNFSKFRNFEEFRANILCLISRKYNHIEYMKKMFDIATNRKYRASIYVYRNNYLIDDSEYVKCLKENINNINMKKSKDEATNNDNNFLLFLNMLLCSIEKDEIITDIFNIFKFYRMDPLLLKKN